MPITERDIEAEHSIMKRRIIFKRAKHTMCSAYLRVRRLKNRLRVKPSLKWKLMEYIDRCRSVKFLANRFGMEATIQKLDRTKSHTRKLREVVKKAAYRADLTEQGKKRKREAAYNTSVTEKQNRQQDKFAGRKAPRVSLENTHAREWLSHFRQVATRDDVLEIPAHLGLTFTDAATLLTTVGAVRNPRCASDIQVASVDGEDEDTLPNIFARVVHFKPNDHKLVRPHAGSGQRLSDDLVTISLTTRFGGASEGVNICAGSSHSGSVVLLGGLQANYQQLKEIDFYAWRNPGPLTYTIKDFPSTVVSPQTLGDLCTEFLNKRAVREENPYIIRDNTEWDRALRVLQTFGYSAETEPGHWHLTQRALLCISFGQTYRSCISLLTPRPGIENGPLQDYTNWELLMKMEDNNWVWHPLPDARHRPAFFEYVPGSLNRNWYGGFDRTYCSALVRASESVDHLHKAGIYGIRHNELSRYYKRVWRICDCEDPANMLLGGDEDGIEGPDGTEVEAVPSDDDFDLHGEIGRVMQEEAESDEPSQGSPPPPTPEPEDESGPGARCFWRSKIRIFKTIDLKQEAVTFFFTTSPKLRPKIMFSFWALFQPTPEFPFFIFLRVGAGLPVEMFIFAF